MAAYEDDGDLYRRRVQQKLAERYTGDTKNDAPESDQGIAAASDQAAAKGSPYCLQNFLWLGVAVAVFYFSDFITVVTKDLRINNTWFWIGVVSLTVHVSIAGFLVFWCNFWKKISTEEWEKKYPKAIPVATAALITGIICLTVGLWPVWGFFTPVILLILGMGVVVIVAMIG